MLKRKGGGGSRDTYCRWFTPFKTFQFYTDSLAALNEAYPEKVIKAFSAVEIEYFVGISGLSAEQVLQQLQKSGLE